MLLGAIVILRPPPPTKKKGHWIHDTTVKHDDKITTVKILDCTL